MPILFSKSCEYAVQAVLLLAANAQREPVLLRDITDKLGIPHHFLSKVLQTLTKDGIVASHKGQSGGYNLGRPPEKIILDDIVRAVDGNTRLEGCLLGFSECNEASPCPVCGRWTSAKQIIIEVLEHRSVAELSRDLGARLMIAEPSNKH